MHSRTETKQDQLFTADSPNERKEANSIMAKQGKNGPSRFQLILLAVAIIMSLLGAAMNFFPGVFPISGEGLTTAGLVTVIISAILTFWLLFTVATKRKKA